jgi:hypothetical protein
LAGFFLSRSQTLDYRGFSELVIKKWKGKLDDEELRERR